MTRFQFRRSLRYFIVLLTLAVSIAVLWLFSLNRNTFVPASWAVSAGTRNSLAGWINQVLLAFYVMMGSFMGALIVHRHPRHLIGWLLLWAGLASALVAFAGELTVYANFTRPGLAWLANGAAWVLNFSWIAPNVLYFWLASIFPNGSLPSRRWRWVQGFVLLFATAVGGAVFIETPMHSAFGLPNPALSDFPGRESLYGILFALGVLGLLGAAVGLIALVIHRFRRAQGDERQQFKWLALSATVGAIGVIAGITLGIGFGSVAGQLLINYSLGFFPLGVGIAVLRYRLYDVDLIIRRTLAYSILTVLLALVYFGGVVVVQQLTRSITGVSSDVAIVVSTLIIAALFLPLRRRVQNVIDRRFYRRKYNAAKTLAEFGAAVRDETDLEKLTARLVEVVQETMQPEGVSLWLKPTPLHIASGAQEAAGDRWPATVGSQSREEITL